jgi:hypothetical protein
LAQLKSEQGPIGEMLYDDNTPCLQTYAITDTSWNAATRKFYCDNATTSLVFSNLKFFFEVLTTEIIVIANQPPTDISSAGLPIF